MPTYASQDSPIRVTLIACRQMNSPATYRQQDRRRIRQVSGWESISGLKSGLFLAQIGPQWAGSPYFSSTILTGLVYCEVTYQQAYHWNHLRRSSASNDCDLSGPANKSAPSLPAETGSAPTRDGQSAAGRLDETPSRDRLTAYCNAPEERRAAEL